MRGLPEGGSRGTGGPHAGRVPAARCGRPGWASGGSGIRPPPRQPARPCLRLAARFSQSTQVAFLPNRESGKMAEAAGAGWSMGGVAESATVLTPNTQGRCDASFRTLRGKRGKLGKGSGSCDRLRLPRPQRRRRLLLSLGPNTSSSYDGSGAARAAQPARVHRLLPLPRLAGSGLRQQRFTDGFRSAAGSATCRADLLHASRPEPAGRVRV